MKKILFATTNERKLKEAVVGCQAFDVHIEQVVVSIDEIQSHDPLEITKHKAKAIFAQLQKPVVVTDTSWNIPSLNGFPGGYMKDVAEWFEPEDFINLLKSKKDKTLAFIETIIYIDSKQTRMFSKEFRGNITNTPQGTG